MENSNPKTQESLWQKAGKLIREVLVIIFGVTVSIWFTERSTHVKEQDAVKTFLVDLKADLKDDTANMKKTKAGIARNSPSFAFLASLNERMFDSLHKVKAPLSFNSGITTTKINGANYEGFKSSGKMGDIENKKLKTLILKYYQDMVPTISELEKLHNSEFFKLMGFMEETADWDSKKIFLSNRFKFLVNNFVSYSKANEGFYEVAIKQAEEVMAEIDKEMAK
jgi:hypothetical protein